MSEVNSILEKSIIEKAVIFANSDGEFLLNAKWWNGSITFGEGPNGQGPNGQGPNEHSWRIVITNGTCGAVESAKCDGISGVGDDVQISANAATWLEVLALVPPSGFVDFMAAAAGGGMQVSPAPPTSERHLAMRRLIDLIRIAKNNGDPQPRPGGYVRPHGTFDKATGRYVHLNIDGLDHRVYFEEAGEGIGLLCQHTAGADGRQFRHFLEDERITSKYRVIVYDMPYHGKSLPPVEKAWWAERYTLTPENAMALPVELSNVLGLDRPVFIGSSVGGMLALDLARFHPDEFRAVISLEGGLHADIPEGALEESQDNDPAKHGATMLMIMSPTAPESSRQETRLHYAQGAPGVFPGDIDYYAVTHDLRGQGHLIDTSKCAVHLLTGEYDFPTIPWTELAGREIPGSTMEIMKGLGHFPMSEDHAGLMKYVQPLLDRIAG